MEEYAKNFRKLVWLKFWVPPIIEEIRIIKEKNNKLFKLYIIKIIGAIFCQVKRMRELFQFNPEITSGNQKWNGAIPNLIKSEEFNNINILILNSWLIWVKNCIKIIIENKKILEAKVWVIKYFSAASEGYIFLELVINGIKDNRLISNPIHILNHEYEEIARIVPKIILQKNKIL